MPEAIFSCATLPEKSASQLVRIFIRLERAQRGANSLGEVTFNTWESKQYCYNARRNITHTWRTKVSDKANIDEREADGVADSMAATGIIAVVVLAMYIWLSGMPS